MALCGGFLFLIGILITCRLATSLECYHCASPIKGDCGDRFDPNNGPKRTCNSQETACFKAVSNKNLVNMVVRDCSDSNPCNSLIFTNCDKCRTELCNSSEGQSFLFSVVFSCVVSLFFVMVN